MTTILQVITTVATRAQAELLAEAITRNRLAACAQIAGPINSTYWWNGKLESAEEWQIAFKTTQASYAELEAALQKQHPYEVPEILAMPIAVGYPAYLEWVAAEVK